MKTFKEYLIEADYKRFLKKNRNLTQDQKKEINDYFSKENRQAGAKIEWQSKKIKNMSYDDFMNIKIGYLSGRKKSIKCNVKIRGLTEGTDYVNVIMKTKEYCAYIPFTFEAAQVFNTKKLGVCSGEYCIGDSTGYSQHWNDEVIEYQQVPIYVINTMSKWVVMIQKGNRNYDIWNIGNDPKKIREGIPNFSVRKELLNPKQKSMYNEIREEYYDEELKETIDTDDAYIDYRNFIEDIDEAQKEAENGYEYYNDKTHRIKNETIEKYQGKIEEFNDEITSCESKIEELESTFSDSHDEVTEDGEKLWSTSLGDITNDEVNEYISDYKLELKEWESELNTFQEELDTIEDIEQYEMSNHDDIDWVEKPPCEDDIMDDVSIPSIFDRRYSDYIEVMENYYDFSLIHSGDDVDREINEYVTMSFYGSTSFDSPEEILNNYNLIDPEYLNE